MFRALSVLNTPPKKEQFLDHNQFVTDQTRRFTKQYPNSYLTSQTDPSLIPNTLMGLATWNPVTRQPTQRDLNLSELAISLDTGAGLTELNNKCKTATIDQLINTQDPSARLRCGWVYQRGTPGSVPKVSSGVLATRNGPVPMFDAPSGTFYWDLYEAQKAIVKDRCLSMTSCTQVGSPEFQNCAYSKTRGVGIPVTGEGNIWYPRDPALTAPVNSLVRNSSGCPPPPPPGSPQAEVIRSRDTCAPMENGRLSRDCMLQQITAAGCKMDGTLYQRLLNSATPNNYAAGLTNELSYRKYQQLASQPLDEKALRDGATTTATALNNFREVAKMASSSDTGAANFAARDLCIQKGVMDTFDFCTELVDGSAPPFALDCLQKEFRRQGGQPAGSDYPNAQTLQMYNSMRNWGAVRTYIANLAAQAKIEGFQDASAAARQRSALKRFYGIEDIYKPVLSQIGRINGSEWLWFNRGNRSFLGRRLNVAAPNSPTFDDNWGDVQKTGRGEYISYVYLTNVRPPTNMKIRLKYVTDDGMLFTLNRNINPDAFFGQRVDNESIFGVNWPQAPTQHIQNSCWSLTANGPNYILGYWDEYGGYATSQLQYAACEGGGYQNLPPNWLTLTIEPDAPMISFEVVKKGQSTTFREYRLPEVFPLLLTPQVRVTDAGLQLKSLNQMGTATTQFAIAQNAWRAFSLTFILGEDNTNPQIPANCMGLGRPGGGIQLYNRSECDQLGGIIHGNGECTKPQGGSFSWDCRLVGTWPGNILCKLDSYLSFAVNGKDFMIGGTVNSQRVGPIRNVLRPDGKTKHYAVAVMRADFESAFPNRMVFAVGTEDDWKSGRASLASPSNSVVIATQNNAPIISAADVNNLTLGQADATIVSCRFFDYELTQKEIDRDLSDSWLRSFF